MIKILFVGIGSWALKKLKVLPKYALTAGVFVAAILYIYNPRTQPHITLIGNSARIELPSFDVCEIMFKPSAWVKSYSLSRIAPRNDSNGQPLLSSQVTKTYDRELKMLIIENTIQSKQSASLFNSTYLLQIYFERAIENDVASVSLDGNPIELKAFFSENLKGKGKYVRFHLIRKWLANVISSTNETYSNIVLTVLCFGIFVEAARLIRLEVIRCISDKCFEKHLIKELVIKNMTDKQQRLDALDEYRRRWWSRDGWYRFLQALGPALGFILTVSSLIQALHPNVLTSKDMDGFLNGIHVAMIATFLGLALRLIALEGARANEQLLFRADALLDKEE